jgi:hypothetical protein
LNCWLAENRKRGKLEEEFGLIDVHDSSRRAEVCLSCHLGSGKEQKLLAHEMYVAGHPPLSGFEIETSADRMPRHWDYPYAPSDGGPQTESLASKCPDPIEPFVRTRNVLVANLVALRESVALMNAQAWQDQPWTGGPQPELARFDCFACHHDLKAGNSAARLNRVPLGRPGRPTVRYWSLPLALATADWLGQGRLELVGGLTKIHRQFDKDVFGSREPRGSELIESCDELIANVEQQSFDEQNVRRLFDTLRAAVAVRGPASRSMDYDAARQWAAAVSVIYRELNHDDGVKTVDEKMDKLLQYVDLTASTTTELDYDGALIMRLQKRDEFDTLKFDGLLRDFFTAIQSNRVSD